MAKKIIWTNKAKRELIDILKYWVERNQSKAFSIKLNNLITEQLKLIAEFPESGKRTDIPNVSLKIIHKYLLYYEMADEKIYILTIRHGSKNPQTLKLK
jgi:plasmid stabilization system protein ParE